MPKSKFVTTFLAAVNMVFPAWLVIHGIVSVNLTVMVKAETANQFQDAQLIVDSTPKPKNAIALTSVNILLTVSADHAEDTNNGINKLEKLTVKLMPGTTVLSVLRNAVTMKTKLMMIVSANQLVINQMISNVTHAQLDLDPMLLELDAFVSMVMLPIKIINVTKLKNAPKVWKD